MYKPEDIHIILKTYLSDTCASSAWEMINPQIDSVNTCDCACLGNYQHLHSEGKNIFFTRSDPDSALPTDL